MENQGKHRFEQIHEFLANANIDKQLKQVIKVNYQFYRFLYLTCEHTIYMNVTEMHIQERFVETYNKWQSAAHGGWLSQQMNNPLMPQVQHPPLQPNTVAEQKRIGIDPPSLIEGKKKKQVKKQKDAELKLELEKRIREMDAQKRKQKPADGKI